MDVGGNVPKLRRGRISLERKKEILAQYDQLGKSCSEEDAAAEFGVTSATLAKILTDRDEIMRADAVQKEIASKQAQDESDGQSSSPKLKRGRLSDEKKKQLLARYDEMIGCSYDQAARRLGITEATLLKLLASRRSLISGKRKRKPADDSSSDSDDLETPSRIPQALGLRRQSPQPGGSGEGFRPGSSGTNMTLRKGRRVRVDYSEDEQGSSDDYVNEDSDSAAETETLIRPGRKIYTPEERERLLAKYDELKPIPQWRAAQIMGITQSTLSNWLQQRNRPSTKTADSEKDLDSLSEEEIDCYVLGSTNGTQVVQFFEVKENPDNTTSIVRKPHLTLREKFEIYQKYDKMDPDAQRNAATTFNVNKSTWFNLITNRYHYEQRFKNRLKKDMERLKQYDQLENKSKTFAAKALKLPPPALSRLLASRDTIEKYYNETVEGDDELVAQSIDKEDAKWKDPKEVALLETRLLQWCKQENEKVKWKVLKYKAKELAAELGMHGFYPSNGWLRKWNNTHKVIKEKKSNVKIVGFGDNRSVTECVLMALKDYPPTNVFNLVETGLYYRTIPGHPRVTNDWVSVAFACNMSGTEKKRLLVAGRSEAPLCFRVMALPLVYKHASLGLTEELISDFLQEWDRELSEAGRDIAVILDSSSCHPNIELTRISLFFVPAELSKEQPLSQGVISHAKALYRKQMAESLQTASFNAGQISIIDALFALAQAWENVPKSLLVSEFLKTAFPQDGEAEPDKDSIVDDEQDRLNRLDDEIQLHSHSSVPPYLQFQDGDVELDGGHVVHMEGTLNLSDEEEEDFDIDSLLRDEVANYPNPSDAQRNPAPNPGSKLKAFLQKPSAPNGSVTSDPNGAPSTAEVKDALATIKRFLQLNACTLEDLTDYTQLEIKVLAKIKNLTPGSKLK